MNLFNLIYNFNKNNNFLFVFAKIQYVKWILSYGSTKSQTFSAILKVIRWEVGQTLTLFNISIYCATIFIQKVFQKISYIFNDLFVVIDIQISVYWLFCNSFDEYVRAPCCIPALIAGTRNLPTRLFFGISSRE